MQNPTLVFKAIQKVKQILTQTNVPKDMREALQLKLEQIEKQIDYIRLQEVLAIFVSQNISIVDSFPVKLKEKIAVGKRFALKEIYYLAQHSQPYYLLALSKKRVPLYRCEGRLLHEIRNNDFPKVYTNEYEYAYPSLGSSTGPGIKNVEGDKSVVEEGRQIDFLKQVDKGVGKYLKDNMQLIVAGVDEELANFKHTTSHGKNIIGVIKGNYAVDALQSLSDMAWEKIKISMQENTEHLLNKLAESLGKNSAIDGIRDVWAMTKLGRGLTLLVERDYSCPGFIDPTNEVKLYLNPPSVKHDFVADAVEEIIGVAADKRGDIVVVENGQLEKYGRIALLLRY
jgi:hypothetical protein